MRTHGTLTKWNDDRDFGFITLAQGGEDVFVHISAFPRDGQRPRLNELISFEVEKDAQGKSRALRVMRPGQRKESRERSRSAQPQRSSRLVSRLVTLAMIAAIGAFMYSRMVDQADQAGPDATASALAMALSNPAASATFQCDGRTTCPQMTSCAEARYFIQHCPSTTMDGDGDGVPCERQWCD